MPTLHWLTRDADIHDALGEAPNYVSDVIGPLEITRRDRNGRPSCLWPATNRTLARDVSTSS